MLVAAYTLITMHTSLSTAMNIIPQLGKTRLLISSLSINIVEMGIGDVLKIYSGKMYVQISYRWALLKKISRTIANIKDVL